MTSFSFRRHMVPSRQLRSIAAAAESLGPLYLVGGSLRDFVLGERPDDLDLVTEGDPSEVASALARPLGRTPFPLGRAPDVTWRISTGTGHIDVWGASHGLDADIMRRDFTVNALFYRLPNGPLIDRVGGLADLEGRSLRMVAEANLAADPLRLLRAVRIVAQRPEFVIEAETGRALVRNAELIREAAAERRVEELAKLFRARAPVAGLRAALARGLFSSFHPAWGDPAASDLALRFTEAATSLRRDARGWLRDALVRVAPAALALPSVSPAGSTSAGESEATATLRAFGWPARLAGELAAALLGGMDLRAALGRSGAAARVAAVRLGARFHDAAACTIVYSRADGDDARAAMDGLVRWHRRFSRRPPPVDGEEIARALHLTPGPRRAAAVQIVREAQAAGLVRTRSSALKLLRNSLTDLSGE